MGIFGSIWKGIKGAGAGFLAGGPIGAAIGGGLGLASSFGGGDDKQRQQQQAYQASGFNPSTGQTSGGMNLNQILDIGGYMGQNQGSDGPSYQQQYGDMVNANEDFQYWEPYTTQSDVNASDALGGYEDVFMDEAGRLQGTEEQLLQAYMESIQRAQDGGASFDEAAAAAAQMGGVAGDIYFGGTAGDQNTFQGQVQGALGSVGQSGFGASSGAIGNAMANAGARGRDLAVQQMTLTAPDVLRTLTQRDIGLMPNVGQQFTNYAGLRSNALENAYGAAASSAELPFARSGERQNRLFQEQAQPLILESLKTPGWLEQQAQLLGTMGTAGLGRELFGGEEGGGLIGKLPGLIGGIFGGGGGGGGDSGLGLSMPDYSAPSGLPGQGGGGLFDPTPPGGYFGNNNRVKMPWEA